MSVEQRAEDRGRILNNLNSILLEGYCTGELEKAQESGVRSIKFTIESHRVYKDRPTVGTFCIIAYGKLVEKTKRLFCYGRGIRVVGVLKEESGDYVIVAEHLEFRAFDCV
jgi:hypothetical protein